MTKPSKRCTICKSMRSLGAFNRKRKSADGLQPHCRECNRRASRAYYLRNHDEHIADVSANKAAYTTRNREVILSHLLEHPCVDCGEADLRVLDFDHVRGSKRREVGRMASAPFSEVMLRSEIVKCEVRCVNCHRRRTRETLHWWRASSVKNEGN